MDTQEKELYQSILIVVGVVGIILLYFIITIIRYQRRSLKLHKEKIQAEIDTLEKERRRIASDLHDELGPLLSAVKLQINSLNTTDPDDEAVNLKFYGRKKGTQLIVKIRGNTPALFFQCIYFGLYFFLMQFQTAALIANDGDNEI